MSSHSPRPAAARAASAVVLGLAAALALASPALGKKLDPGTAGAGLKEALSLGTGKAVDILGVADGFLGNKDVRIPVPESFDKVEKVLRAVGQEKLVDEFETSMNRAAEAAVPVAKEVFLGAVREMTFQDAMAILRGGDHAATDYLEEHAGPKLLELFSPIVQEKLDAVGATRAFDQLMGKFASVPFAGGKPAFDLNRYVTGKALDGLFLMVAREEENIRKNVAGRTTDLLRTVFGSKEAAGATGAGKDSWWKKIEGEVGGAK